METVKRPCFAFSLKDISVPSYASAVSEIAPVLSKMGTGFGLASTELVSNVTKVKDTGHRTIEEMLAAEKARGVHTHDSSGSVGLLWTYRALLFVETILDGLRQGDCLSKSTSNAYGVTLSQYHPWAVRAMFAVGLKLVPHTDVFINSLGSRPDMVLADIMLVHSELKEANAAVKKLLEGTDCAV